MSMAGWYYCHEWGETDTPEYWDGTGSPPNLSQKGPFKTLKEAYQDQEVSHRYDAMESRGCARWCGEQIKKIKPLK